MKFTIFLILVFTSFRGYSQNYIVKVEKSSGGSFVKITDLTLREVKEYWMDDSTIQKLDNALRRSLGWSAINRKTHIPVLKQVATFRPMERHDYEKTGYALNKTLDGSITFKGYNDGSNSCEVEFYNPNNFTSFHCFLNGNNLTCFINTLEGKSCESDVDKIYH